MCSMPGYCTFTAQTRPSLQHGAVHLRERRGRDGLLVELGEDLLERPPELALDVGADVLERLRRHFVLEAGEHVDVGVGQDVRARAEELAGLDQQALVLDRRLVEACCALQRWCFSRRGSPHSVPFALLAEADELVADEDAGQHLADVDEADDAVTRGVATRAGAVECRSLSHVQSTCYAVHNLSR